MIIFVFVAQHSLESSQVMSWKFVSYVMYFIEGFDRIEDKKNKWSRNAFDMRCHGVMLHYGV